jgi:dihydrofolate reductase
VSDDEAGAAIGEEIGRIDALLLGRKTYDIFAAYWPHQSDEIGGTLNRVPKFVVSNSLVAPAWAGIKVLPNAEAAGRTWSPVMASDTSCHQVRERGGSRDAAGVR